MVFVCENLQAFAITPILVFMQPLSVFYSTRELTVVFLLNIMLAVEKKAENDCIKK